MSPSPLVSVICLCHNHAQYVSEAIRSVLSQDYANVELILVDDASTDGSKEIIEQEIKGSSIHFIDLNDNVGNCVAFNTGLKASSGEYIIDLAADDLLLPNRISIGMKAFFEDKIGVEFCNVMKIASDGNELGPHFQKEDSIPQGDIYLDLIQRYFISPPGMMICRTVLEELGGYDESLSYEDFDFWIRSSRNHHYAYTDEVLVKKRILPNSLSKKQFSFRTKHQKSTLKVCQKIKELNRSEEENQALKKRCFYEIKQCIKQGNFGLIPEFLKLTNPKFL